MTKILTIKRKYDTNQTFGHLTLTDADGKILFNCKTLELKWLNNKKQISCIPEGDYIGVIRLSTKYGRHIHITNVKDRDLILIHFGNYAGSINPKTNTSDILGCVLVGSGYSDINKDGISDIIQSTITFKGLMSKIGDEKILIRIIS